MKSRAWMVGLLLIMAVVCSTALSLVNVKTAPVIQRNREITYMSTVLDVFGIPYDRKDKQGIVDTYKGTVEEMEIDGLRLFKDRRSGGTAVSFEGSGFQGPISLVVALDGDTITGFKVVSQVETPGLGARITEEEFQKSFIGKRVSGGIRMTKSGNAGPGEFDAVTGATETSRALEKILNRGFERYFAAMKKHGS